MSVQAERDDVSGIRVSDRYFEPEMQQGDHIPVWIITDVLVLSLIFVGLLVLVATGFGIMAGILFYIAAVAVCTCTVFLFRSKWHGRHRFLDLTVIIIAWLFTLWITQDRFINGAKNFAMSMSITVNRTYGSMGKDTYSDVVSANLSDVHYFLFVVFVPVAYLLGFALLKVRQMLLVYMIVFPVIILLALCGACDNAMGLFFVLGGILLCRVHMGPLRQKRMWGGRRKKLLAENTIRYENIQKFSIITSLAVGIILFIPGYFLIRPMLSFSFKTMETVSFKIQSSFLSSMVKILPDISAGKLNLQVESTGGGVDDGKLDSGEGYQIDNVDDIKVTIDTKPEENIYLRGFVGSLYKDGKWNCGYGSTFDAAAMNWNTDGSPRLYVQNLEFLRTAYASEQDKITADTAKMKVERINANDKYTYIPYGVYLNDYYTVDAGDGFINSQMDQDDEFLFYFRKDAENVLSVWNEENDTDNVMDRVEESYRAYCETNYLDVGGFTGKSDLSASDITTIQELSGVVGYVNTSNRWKGQKNLDDITAWIRSYLDDNYEYSREYDNVPDGEDSLTYFLSTSKKGDSVQFASAAVMLYRMFGIPARYVIGYEIPYGMFTAQPDGTWVVTCQGENSQAWAEIYKDGIGWVPEDLTPGAMGSYDEIGSGGELVEKTSSGDDKKTVLDDKEDTANDNDGESVHTARKYSVSQIIGYLLYFVAAALSITACVYGIRFLFVSFGYTFAGRRNRRKRLIGEFQTFVRRMRKLGLPDDVDSQDEEFAEFCESILGERYSDLASQLRPCIDRIYCICYAGEDVTEEDVTNMRKFVKAGFKVKRIRRF